MPRRKKETASVDVAPSSVKTAKKKKRVGVAVRVVKENAKPAVKTVKATASPAAPTPVTVPPAPVQPAVAAQPEAAKTPAIKPEIMKPIEPPVQPQPVVEKVNRPYSDKEKSMIMWTAVIFIMIMVFGLWFMSIKLQLKEQVPDNPASQFDFKKVSDDISSTMREVNDSLKQLASTTPTSTPPVDALATSTYSGSATTTGEVASTTSLDEAAIQRTIKELEAQLNRGTTTATSTVR